MHFSLTRRKQLFPIRHWNEHENSFHFPSLSTLIALEEKGGPKPSLLTIKVECQIFVPIIIVIIAVQKPFFSFFNGFGTHFAGLYSERISAERFVSRLKWDSNFQSFRKNVWREQKMCGGAIEQNIFLDHRVSESGRLCWNFFGGGNSIRLRRDLGHEVIFSLF